MTSCLILGGGINGLLSAFMLRQAGLDVRVLDRAATGMESSWAGAGVLSLLLPWNYAPEVNALAQCGRTLWRDWAARLQAASGIDPEYLACGMAALEVDQREAALAWCALHDEPVAALPPALAHLGNHAGIWLPNVAQVRNPRLMQALREAVLRAGIAIHEETPATRLLTDGARVTGVETPSGTFAADTVVVAAGAWSGALLITLFVLGMNILARSIFHKSSMAE